MTKYSFFHKAVCVTIAIVVFIILYLLLSFIRKKRIKRAEMDKADIIIVGGGVAGCVAARRLHTAYPNKKILILERGKDESGDPNVYNIANAITAAFEQPYSELLFGDFPGVVVSSATM